MSDFLHQISNTDVDQTMAWFILYLVKL